MIGHNIRQRRKKLKLSQQDVAQGDWTRSYISQIERGHIQPSLETLTKIAIKLDTTVADSVGDQLLLQKAKATVLYPQICKQFLAKLPRTTTTIFLDQLTNSLLSNNTLDCQLPPNPELYYLTARVLIFQKNYPLACRILEDGLRIFDVYWRILFLVQLCTLYELLEKPEQLAQAKQQIKNIMNTFGTLIDLNYKLVQDLSTETDPVRCAHLMTFLNSMLYGADLERAFQLSN